MFKSIYETTFCKYNVNKIASAIAHAKIQNMDNFEIVHYKGDNSSRSWVYVVTAKSDHIPPFGHPVVIFEEYDDRTNQKEVAEFTHPLNFKLGDLASYVDVRNFTSIGRDGSLNIKSHLDYETAILRGMLTKIWIKEGPESLQSLGFFPVTVFSRWITELLTRRLMLTPDVQLKTTIMVAFFFLCQFHQEDVIHEKDRLKMATVIAKATHSTVETILGVIGELPLITTITELCETLKSNADTIRFEHLNPALLYTIVNGSWFGFNRQEIVGVAIEHVPTFITLLYQAVNERGFRNTILGKIAKDYTRADNDKQFVRSVEHLLG